MAIYKISYVVVSAEKDYPGAILNQKKKPEIGELVRIRNEMFEVTEVIEIIPPRGSFHFYHATCRPAAEKKP